MWNFAMALLHAGLATTTLLLGNWDLEVPLYKTVLDFRYVNVSGNASNTSAPWELIPLYRESFPFPLTLIVAAFFILSSFFHLINCTLARAYYLSELAQCRTPTRWLEYSLSAPLMILAIAVTLGVRDQSTLLSLAVLVCITMPFGYWVEQLGRPTADDQWSRPLAHRLGPWFLGHLPQTAAWLVIVAEFYTEGADADDVIPWFVYLILWSEAALFYSFGLASLWSQCGPPSRFYRGEQLFQFLSLSSKALLGGVLLSQVLLLSQFEEIYE